MIPILRADPEDKTKAQLFWDGKEFSLSTAKCAQWFDILKEPVIEAACEKVRMDKAVKRSETAVEGWGIFR